jgi:flagellar biosynthetic protein FlhB
LAEGDFQEKTEKPTGKKRSKAREEGNVAKSREVGSLAVVLAGLSTLCLFGSFMYGHIGILMRESFSMIQTPTLELPGVTALAEHVLGSYIVIVLPVMIGVALVGVLSNLAQVGIMFSWKAMAPKFSKLNPLKGLAKLASKQAFMELFKSVAKIALVGLIAYRTFKGEMDQLPELGGMDVSAIGLYILKVILKMFLRVCVVMAFLAIIDYAFQKWQHEEKLKMTKQEVKEENKQTEGDPLVKSRIRKVQMEAARRRMMQEVPKADVVVTNPVHLALAIRYDRAVMNAPRVVAKGSELVAEKIKALAREHGIPIVENKELAQSLYKAVDIEEEIPSDFFQAVAEVLAYVYRIKGKVA